MGAVKTFGAINLIASGYYIALKKTSLIKTVVDFTIETLNAGNLCETGYNRRGLSNSKH